MGEGSNDPASKDLPPPDIPTLVQRCLKVEQDRSLSDNSMKELRRYLSEFLSYCQGKNIYFVDELTPAFMKTCASSGRPFIDLIWENGETKAYTIDQLYVFLILIWK